MVWLATDPNGRAVQQPLLHPDGVRKITPGGVSTRFAIPDGWGGFFVRCEGGDVLRALGDGNATVSDADGGYQVRLVDGDVFFIVRARAQKAAQTHLAHMAKSGSPQIELYPVEG